jgi:hypothetical protein
MCQLFHGYVITNLLILPMYMPPVYLAQHIYKNNLIKPGGSITLTIGISYQRPEPGWSLAGGVVGALESSTRGLAIDLKPIRWVYTHAWLSR